MDHPIAISWSNLSYEISSLFTSQSKLVLNRLNGSFRYGTLNYLMGPSGSGKSTFLNCLSGRTSSGLSSGITADSIITVNRSCNQSTLSSCFIKQHVHESIYGQLTIRQILQFAFQFKNGRSASSRQEEVNQHIAGVLQQLMLPEDILERKFAKCSGGEQKRVAIGQEMMAKERPVLVFADEPTTGLDSSAAFEMMSCLKRLTENGICVIASIHQPNSDTLKLFDSLYVLAKGGVCIYFGSPVEVEKSLGGAKLKTEQPAIELLLKIACDGPNSPKVAQLSTDIRRMETTQHQTSSSSNSFSEAFSRRKSTSLFDLQVHLHRQFHLTFIASYRTVLFFILLYALNYILVATVFSATSKEAGCLSSDTSSAVCSLSFDEEIEFKENAFNLCYTVLYVGLVMIYSSTAVFAGNVRCFRNEHRNNWYSLNVFYLSSVTVSLLELTLFSVIISTLAFFVTSQHAADDYQLNLVRFGYFTLFIWTLCLYVQGIGQLIGVLLINWHDLAAIVSIVLYLCISMLNGFFVNTDISGNPLIITGTNAVALKFISRGLVYSIYGIDRCAAEDEESVILPFLNIDVDTVWTDCWWIVVNLIVCRMATFALMQWRFAAATQRVKKKAVVNGGKLELELGGIDNPVKVELEELHSNGKSPHQADLPLASKPLILAWKNVTLYASSNSVNPFRRHAPRKMLQSLNGHFRFGTLGALMGTSGAGKTTLLKVLNGQCKSRLSPESSFHLAKATPLQTCFLTQEVSGHLMPGLTVRQSVLYASKLKNRNYYDNQSAQLVVVDHEKLVENLLVELGIKDVEDTKVERCSGGERKRIALALELASRQMPNLICIDEPTSGLDSNSAEIVISCLRNLTRQHPITIIASLHQPNTEILHMIDQLYVLALGGSCIYSGPPQNIKARLGALTSQSATEHCDKFPIEELIELSCLGADNITVQELVRYHNEEEVSMENELLAQTEPKGLLRKRTSLSLHSAAVLSQRYFHYFLGHHWRYLAFYFSNYIGYALFLKLFFNFNMVYLDGCLNARDGLVLLQNRCTASEATIADMFLLMDNLRYTHFFSVFYLTFIYLQAAFDYRQDLVYFVNEHRNGWYSTLTFYAVKSLTEIVPLLLLNLVYVYVCNYYEFIRVGLFWEIYLVLTLASIGFQGLAHILALLTRGNFARLTILSITLTLFAVLLDDYLILHHRLHFVYQVLSNLSIPRFAYEALIMLQYGFGRCKAGQTQAMFYVMQLSDEDIYYCIGMLVGNLILYRVVAVYLLIRRVDGSGLRWLRCATTKKRDSCASSGSK